MRHQPSTASKALVRGADLRSKARMFVGLPLAMLLLTADALLGLFGYYIQAGLLSFRTLLVPTVEILLVVALIMFFVRRAFSEWKDRHRVSAVYFALVVLSVVVVAISLDVLHGATVNEIDTKIVDAVQFGQSTQIESVSYLTPDASRAAIGRRCELGAKTYENWFGSTFNLTCNENAMSVDVVYLWSKARITVKLARS